MGDHPRYGKVKVAHLYLILCNPMVYYSPWNSPGQNIGVGSLSPSPGDFPNPGIEPRSPALQVDSLPAEPQRKPKNSGVGSLSLLQRIFLTQELNQSFLHWYSLPTELSGKQYVCLLMAAKWLLLRAHKQRTSYLLSLSVFLYGSFLALRKEGTTF